MEEEVIGTLYLHLMENRVQSINPLHLKGVQVEQLYVLGLLGRTLVIWLVGSIIDDQAPKQVMKCMVNLETHPFQLEALEINLQMYI
jgi:hypothetical protein